VIDQRARSSTRFDTAIVALLLEKNSIDLNSKDKDGRSVLSLAAEKGYEGVVRLLLANKGTVLNEKDSFMVGCL
jgi:ankyrin repeat protein